MLVITLRGNQRGQENQLTMWFLPLKLDQQWPDAARKEYEKGAQASEKGKIQRCYRAI